MNIAVDAMGGDYAPHMAVRGAVQAAAELGVDITLVGESVAIEKELHPRLSTNRVTIHHCEESIRMDDSPLQAVRKKKRASIRVAFNLVKEGTADAVVSAGNSGATLASGVLVLGRMQGVDRPAIASVFPGEKGYVVLIDVGANVDCRPSHLFQFGVLAHAFATSCLGMENPAIGLLSIGEEGSKGNELVRQTRQLYEESPLNFTGNVEGRDIFTGNVQIIVCDGFVGNVALKLSEGMGEAVTRSLKTELKSSLFGRVALLFGRRSLDSFTRKLNYEEYGGAPLLGINGIGIVCHGQSSSNAIRNAVRLAVDFVNSRLIEKMREQCRRHG
ncbi:MAG: phosphate--acyl-ACP acyltransferase [Desulfococcus sp. 4484_242]|nr:MAG: phosphate--acyl-ACP acyltransferase [Desulfococcus sp. 4484_242]